MTQPATSKKYQIVDFNSLPAVPCPCGSARRAFADVEELPITVHRTQISEDARLHYHRKLTETYYLYIREWQRSENAA